MNGVNKVILVGNATRDAELRHTQSGKVVTSIRLATNRRVHGAEASQFHSITCWDTLAETTAKYVTKGRLLYVEGRLAYRTYTDAEGQPRGTVEIVAEDVQFLGSRGDAAGPESGASTAGPREEGDRDDVPR